MAEPPAYPDPSGHTRLEPEHAATGTPRWVKLFGIVALTLVLLFGILHLTGNSLGGPGSHALPREHGAQPR